MESSAASTGSNSSRAIHLTDQIIDQIPSAPGGKRRRDPSQAISRIQKSEMFRASKSETKKAGSA